MLMLLVRKFCCKIVTCTEADFRVVGDETCGFFSTTGKVKLSLDRP